MKDNNLVELHDPGTFCEIYGITIRNRILEYLLSNQWTDWAVGDIAKELKISRPKVYEIIAEFEKKNYVKKTRIIGKTQLHILNKENPVVKLFMKNFMECLNLVVEEYSPKKVKQKPIPAH